MAKVTRKKLTRGARLKPGHVTTPLSSIATELENVDVQKEQMQAPTAPFCVNLTLPYLSHVPWGGAAHSIPFALPPTQDFFSKGSDGRPVYSAALPQIKLRSVSFSFDQRAEPAAIASNIWTLSASGKDSSGSSYTTATGKYGYSTERGKLYYEGVNRLMIRLSIREKNQAVFGDAYPYNSTKELWSTTIPASAFAGEAFRSNPFIQTDLDITVDPYRTLIFTIECPGLEDAGSATDASLGHAHLALPSIEASLKFSSELIPRDEGRSGVENPVQNIPVYGGSSASEKYGAKTGPTVTVTAPTLGLAASVIQADTTDGVGANMTVIDDEFVDKFEGGWDKFADLPPTETIEDDAAYCVFAVPLFQNQPFGGVNAQKNVLAASAYMGRMTEVGATSMTSAALFDRRIVPIHHSYTLHHAVLAWNWSPWRVLGYTPDTTVDPPVNAGAHGAHPPGAFSQSGVFVPPTTQLTMACEVGLGTGSVADSFNYQMLAGLNLSGPSIDSTQTRPNGWGESTTLIDRVVANNSPPIQKVNNGAGFIDMNYWHWELHSMELQGNGVSSSNSYYDTAKPIFMGPGWSRSADRSNMNYAAGAGGPQLPHTDGAEQWIEVRSKIYNNTLVDNNSKPIFEAEDFTTSNAISTRPSIVVGYGGCYVYLICKKHLTR